MKLLPNEKEGTAPVRMRELETGCLVCRAVRSWLGSSPGAPWLSARAATDVADLVDGVTRRALGHAVECLAAPSPDRRELSQGLVAYGGILERHRLHEEAVEAYETALAVLPEDAELMLHAARSRRKAGDRESARALYGRVRERGDGRLARFSALGEALISASPVEELGAVERAAAEAGDPEVRAVALEERARLLRREGGWRDAVEDLTRAALCYQDRRDRLRVAHSLADLLLARGDMDGAREALGAALDLSPPEDADHTIQRLRTLARAQNDQVGLRRWPPRGRSPLVSLMPVQERTRHDPDIPLALRQWRDALLAEG